MPPPAPAPWPRWEVVFTYTEPEYAIHRGLDPPPIYRAIFVVEAMTEDEAREAAFARFRAGTIIATVGWARVVQTTACRRVEGE